jgi:hypothetical protein
MYNQNENTVGDGSEWRIFISFVTMALLVKMVTWLKHGSALTWG